MSSPDGDAPCQQYLDDRRSSPRGHGSSHNTVVLFRRRWFHHRRRGQNAIAAAAVRRLRYYRCTIDTRAPLTSSPQKSHSDGRPATVYRSWRDVGGFDDPTETRWPTPRGRSRGFRKSVGRKKKRRKTPSTRSCVVDSNRRQPREVTEIYYNAVDRWDSLRMYWS